VGGDSVSAPAAEAPVWITGRSTPRPRQPDVPCRILFGGEWPDVRGRFQGPVPGISAKCETCVNPATGRPQSWHVEGDSGIEKLLRLIAVHTGQPVTA